MPSADVEHELAVIFERLGRIDAEIDAVEAELRARAEDLTPLSP